jgi:glutathione-specific gamma-glutamylcyclotransferase
MRLTHELISRVHEDMDDPGPVPDVPHMDDHDYAGVVDDLVSHMETGDPIRVFAYGSLMWNPECDVGSSEVGVLHGWHRAFCMRMLRYRGSMETPGLMMGLDRGGSCRGLVQTLDSADVRASLDAIVRRELITKPCTYSARWLSIKTDAGPVKAITFVIDRKGRFYEGGLCPESTAKRLAHAVGHIGTNAEYLMNTVQHLKGLGISDRNLCRLETLVAREIASRY